ncbi:hypothetical protein HDU98_006140 [Podochytrium sp. JEL0797]|nr:hypothetical protein HDU98_006140 [Podochytrium sp. JEL0797]
MDTVFTLISRRFSTASSTSTSDSSSPAASAPTATATAATQSNSGFALLWEMVQRGVQSHKDDDFNSYVYA